MEAIYFEKLTELKRNLALLQSELDVKITIKGKQTTIEGESVNEYEARIVLEAISFGFSAKKALYLKEPDMIFRILHIKDFTRRKNLEEVRGRIIGSQGRTKKTIEAISDCHLVLNGNELGIIAHTDLIEEATTALENLIKGSKQGNVYKYLEKMNKSKKEDSLALKS
jgi:ribosomal RNA assembly protein